MKNIVIGVDFSDRARGALTEAARLAKWNEAKLHLVHVVEKEAATELARHERRDVEELRAELVADAKQSLKEWGAETGLPEKTSLRVVYGDASDELIKQIRQVNAELCVVGVRGMVNEARGTGSQATRIVRKAPCRVLLVEDGKVPPYRRIVAGVDFSPASREVVEQALSVARQDGSKVCFLHVYAAPWRKLHYRSESRYSGEFRQQYLDELMARLREGVGETGDVEVQFDLRHSQSHGCEISEYARTESADLVVIGTRGKSSLKYLLLGSTAEYVLRERPCSVLAVRPGK